MADFNSQAILDRRRAFRPLGGLVAMRVGEVDVPASFAANDVAHLIPMFEGERVAGVYVGVDDGFSSAAGSLQVGDHDANGAAIDADRYGAGTIANGGSFVWPVATTTAGKAAVLDHTYEDGDELTVTIASIGSSPTKSTGKIRMQALIVGP